MDAHRFNASLEDHEGERAEQGVAENEHAHAEARQQPRGLRGGGGAAAAATTEQFRAAHRRIVVVVVAAVSTRTASRRPLVVVAGVLHRSVVRWLEIAVAAAAAAGAATDWRRSCSRKR